MASNAENDHGPTENGMGSSKPSSDDKPSRLDDDNNPPKPSGDDIPPNIVNGDGPPKPDGQNNPPLLSSNGDPKRHIRDVALVMIKAQRVIELCLSLHMLYFQY